MTRKGVIYCITCTVTFKQYIGQAYSEILNRKKYIPHGANGRFNTHVSEAFAPTPKKGQSLALNNAIRKYGKENFIVETLIECNITELDDRETECIIMYGTMFPNGYNLTKGGRRGACTEEVRARISATVKAYFSNPENRKKQSEIQKNITHRNKYKNNLPKYICEVKNKQKKVIGYVVQPHGSNIRKSFCGKPLDVSLQEAKQFLDTIKASNNAKDKWAIRC